MTKGDRSTYLYVGMVMIGIGIGIGVGSGWGPAAGMIVVGLIVLAYGITEGRD